MEEIAILLITNMSLLLGSTRHELPAWNRLKITSPILIYYDPSKETTVAADASSYGIGAVLLQSHNGKLMPIAYASRSLTDCKCHYAQIEKELLSLTWECEKFQRYLIGLPEIKLITDHKPLIPIINQKDLDDVPIRCQGMLMRLMQFNCLAEYLPGKSLNVPDALSRSPLPREAHDICEISEFVSYVPASDVMVHKFQQATARIRYCWGRLVTPSRGGQNTPATSLMNWNSCTASEHICPCHKACYYTTAVSWYLNPCSQRFSRKFTKHKCVSPSVGNVHNKRYGGRE